MKARPRGTAPAPEPTTDEALDLAVQDLWRALPEPVRTHFTALCVAEPKTAPSAHLCAALARGLEALAAPMDLSRPPGDFPAAAWEALSQAERARVAHLLKVRYDNERALAEVVASRQAIAAVPPSVETTLYLDGLRDDAVACLAATGAELSAYAARRPAGG